MDPSGCNPYDDPCDIYDDPCDPYDDPCDPYEEYAKAIGIEGFSSQSHEDIVDMAIEDAKTFVDDAIKRLERWNSQDAIEFRRVFGRDRYRQRVLRGFKAIRKTLNKKIYWKETTLQPPNRVAASVFRGKPVEIKFYPVFFTLPRTGFPSRTSIIIHEMSHEVLNTGDLRGAGYGRRGVSYWSRHGSHAVRNADSWAAYAMRAFR